MTQHWEDATQDEIEAILQFHRTGKADGEAATLQLTLGCLTLRATNPRRIEASGKLTIALVAIKAGLRELECQVTSVPSSKECGSRQSTKPRWTGCSRPW